MSRPGPANYTANVNRAKTKKWVEAKSYSYDGDDWGDVDDYDEYGGYDEPEPEPAPKPTGLRQRGQSATQMPQEAYEAREEMYQSPIDQRQQYGNTSAPPPHHQQRAGPRSFTNPQSRAHPGMIRTNSFEQEDDQHAFSAGGSRRFDQGERQDHNTFTQDFHPIEQHQNFSPQPQPIAMRPTVQGSGRTSLESQARYGEQPFPNGGASRGASYNDQARRSNMGSRSQSMTSNNSAMEFHSRRDFSPSAMPPPLQTRGSPSPQRPDQSSSSRPPRKSSLGQSSEPVQPSEASLMPLTRDREEDASSARDRAGSGAGKPLPFVRPAEIYRRMQEEKEKERQSQDSSRPSMDAILGGPNDRPSLARSQDSESSQRLKPTLDPVKERRSEYGIEGVNLQGQETSGERRSTSSKTFEFPKSASKPSSHAPKSSLGPMLPDVSRVSGFGESFFGSTYNPSETLQDPVLNFAQSSPPQPDPQSEPSAPKKDLQHQPSLGFTSAVHQAFDKAEDQVPPTPSSTQGSSVGRSVSGGTSTVSPIISRGPSTATENWNSRLPGIDSVSTPMIPEAPEGSNPRPMSSSSLGTPTQIARKPSPSQSHPPPETEQPPPSFIPGYRRNSDTPSPDNSPRRTPALETSRPLRQPQEVEIAAATPTDPSVSSGSGSQASDMSSEENSSREGHVNEVSDHVHKATTKPEIIPGRLAGGVDSTISPISPISSSHERLRRRTDSSSSSRVRNLADKFEGGSRPGSAHSTTPRASVLVNNAQKKDDWVPPRPLADRMESFRPHLPGGWESSASVTPVAAFGRQSTSEVRQGINQTKSSASSDPDTVGFGRDLDKDEETPAPDQHPSAVTQVKDASEEAFAAVAAAGSALAGAFGTAIGVERHDSSPTSTAATSSNERTPLKTIKGEDPPLRKEGTLHPEASRSQIPVVSDDEASTIAPTPLSSDVPQGTATQQDGQEYFPPAPVQQDFDATKSKQTPALPLLSTDAKPHQYESDRLRKEIVRELTPMSGSEPTTAETDYSNYQQSLSTKPSVSHPKHESGVLPKEYESYWNDAASDDEEEHFNEESDQHEKIPAIAHQGGEASIVQPLQPNQGHERASPIIDEKDKPSRDKSPMLPHRFSWEQPLQELSPESEPTRNQPAAPSSDFLRNAVYPDDHFHTRDELVQGKETSPLSTEPKYARNDSPQRPEAVLADPRRSLDSSKELSRYSNGLELASSPAEKEPQGSPLVERSQGLNSVVPQSPTAHDYQKQEPELPQPEYPVPANPDVPAPSHDLPSIPPPSTTQPKIPGFREISALKSPSERIRTYNDSREQYAGINTGLAYWLTETLNDLPEHSDLLANSGRMSLGFQGHKPGPSKSKFGGLLPSGGQANQQPYFQQYLNASPGSAAPDGSAPGGVIGGGPSQGFSPSGGSGGKLSGQQVQAKGKDLLHSAGVFGGKANVAAKGLFSKGKSKLRAASGTEKV